MFIVLACAEPDATETLEGDTAAETLATVAEGHYFPNGAQWYQNVTDATVDGDSRALIDALQSHGWGMGRFQIDFSISVLSADAGTERSEFTPTTDFYSPDCDQVPVPLPEGGHLEGESDYACTNNGDCHLIVADRDNMELFEMWRADVRGDTFKGGCLAVWDMSRVYGDEGRCAQCTSADAAGYPIAPLLFSADEVAAGEIDHAIRFILPNTAIRDGEYYAPATHATNAEGGGETAIPYGAHLRLSPDFDEASIEDPEARVVAVALKTYGMFLADGGNIALTAQADTETTGKWADLFDSHALDVIEPKDFEVLALGEPVPLTFECERAD